MNPKRHIITLFLIVPAIIFIFSLLLRSAAGPFWLATNFDPSYLYLINGLHILKGIPLNDVTHPGTPLQILCGVVEWVFNVGQPIPNILANIFLKPEFYLHVVFMILTLFTLATSIAVGVYVYRDTQDQWMGLLTQLPIASFLVLKSWESPEPILPVVANVCPETMLLGICNLFTLCLFRNLYATTLKKEIVSGLWWAVACGFGIAVKLTFLPLCLIPLIVLPMRIKKYFFVVCIITFFLATIPAWSQFPLEWGWVSHFLTQGGRFQSQQQGLDIGTILANAGTIVIHYWIFVVALGVALGLVFEKVIHRRFRKQTFFLMAVIMGILVQLLVVAKNTGGPHYLVPGFGLYSALLALVYADAMVVWKQKVAIILVTVGIVVSSLMAGYYYLNLSHLSREMLSFVDEVHTQYSNCTFLDYYRSSDPQNALFFGDGWNLSLGLRDDLFKTYPNRVFFPLWENALVNFHDERVWSNDLLTQDACVIFQGDGAFDFGPGPYHVRLLQKGRFESIHLLTQSTEKQAAILIAAAAQFYQSGQYTKAMACVYQARKLHYQPDNTAVNLMKLIAQSAGS